MSTPLCAVVVRAFCATPQWHENLKEVCRCANTTFGPSGSKESPTLNDNQIGGPRSRQTNRNELHATLSLYTPLEEVVATVSVQTWDHGHCRSSTAHFPSGQARIIYLNKLFGAGAVHREGRCYMLSSKELSQRCTDGLYKVPVRAFDVGTPHRRRTRKSEPGPPGHSTLLPSMSCATRNTPKLDSSETHTSVNMSIWFTHTQEGWTYA